jgi:hypothetical protein
LEKLAKRAFKVKHKETSEYWNGHGGVFSLSGKVFKSALDAAFDIDRSRIRIRNINGRTPTLASLVVIEEVNPDNTTEVLNEIPTEDAIAAMKLRVAIMTKYGYPFFCLWQKVTSTPKFEGAKYLVQVKEDYKAFRERLTELGCSSRTYKKVGDWIVLFDDDAAMRIKLLDGYEQFIHLGTFIEDLK